MDKHENEHDEDILNDILSDETNETNEIPEMPETLKGDDEIKENSEDNENSENENGENAVDLSEFTEENQEPGYAVEGAEQVLQEKKKSGGMVKQVSIIVVVAALIIGGGLFAFFQLSKTNGNYIMSFDNKKIDMEEYKLFILSSDPSSEDVKQSALDGLIDFLLFEKTLKNYNVVIKDVLNDEQKEYLKSNIDEYKNYFTPDIIPVISDERLDEIFCISIVSDIRYALLDILTDKIAEENKFSLDESAVATELAAYRSTDKLLTYILTETRTQADEAYEALISGTVSNEDAIVQYSVNYEYAGIEQLSLSEIGLPEAINSKVMALGEKEFSEIINLGVYVVFIAPTLEETENWYKETYPIEEGSETDFETEFKNFMSTEKPMKYIVTEELGQIEEALNMLSSGAMTADEVIALYSLDYEQYGIQLIELNQIGLEETDKNNIMALNENEVSAIIELGNKVIFIVATDKETEDWVRESALYYQKNELLNSEMEYLETETKIKVNEKTFDEFDLDKYLESVAVG